jgi:hypothetical protein
MTTLPQAALLMLSADSWGCVVGINMVLLTLRGHQLKAHPALFAVLGWVCCGGVGLGGVLCWVGWGGVLVLVKLLGSCWVGCNMLRSLLCVCMLWCRQQWRSPA